MYLFFTLLVALLGISALFAAGSALFAWYERANRRPGLMEHRFAPRNLWFVFRFLTLETGCLALIALLHPLGWIPHWNRHVRRDTTPVILIHGLFHNRACWFFLLPWLRSRGVRSLCTINLPLWKGIESLTERVARKVDELRLASGCERVHLVGHSLGGIIARNYLQIRGGAAKVDRCILIATPNEGSRLAALALSPLATSLMPGSDLLTRLAAAPLPAGARLSVIHSRHDNIVLPAESARFQGAEDLELAGVGHTALLFHPRVWRELARMLSGAPS